nr:putative receptor-like protein kinase [Ipomoea batatas]
MKRVQCLVECQLCQIKDETISHLFIECELANSVWTLSGIPLTTHGFSTFANWLDYHLPILDKDKACLLLMLCWKVWLARNDKVWNGKMVVSSSFVKGTIVMPEHRLHMLYCQHQWKSKLQQLQCNIAWMLGDHQSDPCHNGKTIAEMNVLPETSKGMQFHASYQMITKRIKAWPTSGSEGQSSAHFKKSENLHNKGAGPSSF